MKVKRNLNNLLGALVLKRDRILKAILNKINSKNCWWVLLKEKSLEHKMTKIYMSGKLLLKPMISHKLIKYIQVLEAQKEDLESKQQNLGLRELFQKR